MTTARWRVALHALDRTGPPRLARSFIEWIVTNRPDIDVDVVAFRGGDLWEDVSRWCPVRVLLRDGEAWDHTAPCADRVDDLRAGVADLPSVDRLLLVSVAAGQVLDLLPPDDAPVVAWVVEQGEDLHWIDGPLRLRDRVDAWFAGSVGTRDELRDRLGADVEVEIAVEFVDDPPDHPPPLPPSAGVPESALLVVGAGIGTHRKAPDLFLELALTIIRRGRIDARYVWIGGETDPLVPLLRREIDRLAAVDVHLVDNTPDLASWLARADVFVHPARLDAFPLVCLEASLAGTPVIAFSGVGGVPEMFGPTFCGAPYPDISSLADAVEDRALGSDLPVLGRRQRDHVRGRFVTSVAAPALVSSLERLRPAAGGVR